ncbi:MAG TPA: beta-ketoacyl-[acyl-carrier-protein] synthase family protein [Candidatus Methanoperedens sp.]|nr:beta-ketoacyl-[acyl-carrier-protein] synthase family protein [Candidatus Methanoperedens sp.]
MANERIAITGLGAVTPLGATVAAFWSALLAGRCGCRRVEAFDITGQRTEIGCEVPGFEPSATPGRPGGRATALAAAAAAEALAQAGFAGRHPYPPERVGACIGTTMGEIRVLETHLERELRPQAGSPPAPPLAGYPCSRITEGVAARFGLAGPNFVVPDACAAGNYALAVARDLILEGEADAMVVGGVDPYSRVAHTGFNRLLAVSPDRCRPFDAQRRGIIPGEGAGILVLESERGARDRGVAILAFLLGCGLTCDAGHMTNPDPTGAGLARAISLALAESGLAPADVDWVSAHGTGTPANDLAETQGIKRAFGERARAVPVSSIKSMIGHTMGAASALEAVASVMAIRAGAIPPTINLEHPDPECDLDWVPNRARNADVRVVLSNSMAFGGINACAVFAAADGRRPHGTA